MQLNEVLELEIDSIIVNPNQPRQFFEESSIQDLANSINEHGLLQPIVVRAVSDNKYELVAGERRFRAFIYLKREVIPAIIKDLDIQESAILAMIENIQREDLHFIEVARGYDQLINKYNITQSELAKTLGKGQSTVANKIRLLSLSDDILQLIMEGDLTERHGRALLKLKDHDLLEKAAKHIIRNELNVKKTEKYIEQLLAKDSEIPTEKPNPEMKAYLKDIRLFTNTIKQAVDMVNKAGVEATYAITEDDEEYTITISVPM